MRFIKSTLLTLMSMCALSLSFAPVVVYAQTTPATPAPAAASDSKKAVCEGLALAGGNCNDKTTNSAVTTLIKTAIRIFQMVIGVIAVFTIITAGLTYITSAGDSGKTATAKNRIMYSAIGLVIVAMAEVIVQFILNQV
jgi:Type IV secretion system pilin